MKPQPVVVHTVCSLCDEPWEAHGDKPTTADCIRLLKERAQRAEASRWSQPYWVEPYVYPRQWWQEPYSYTLCDTSGTTTTTTTTGYAVTVNYCTPDDGEPPAAVAA